MLRKQKQRQTQTQTQTLWLQKKLQQCCAFSVAGASGMSVGGLGPLRGFVLVERPWSSSKGNEDGSRGWNVGRSGSESGGGCCGEEQGRGGDCGGGGSFFRGVDARWQQWCRVVGAMWKVEAVLMMMMMMTMMMRGMEQEEADRWSLAFVDLIENCCSSSACGIFQAGISCGGCAKVTSNADHQNTSDLFIERNVTELCWLGNDVTVSCSSVILKWTNAGRELQRNAMQKEALANAHSLQEDYKRQFILVQIVESRVGQDRRVPLSDPKCYSATFKKQVFDAQSLELVEGSSATSSQPDVLQHWQPCLYRGSSDSLFQSFMVLCWRSIWTLWHFFLLQWMKSVLPFQIRWKKACVYSS